MSRFLPLLLACGLAGPSLADGPGTVLAELDGSEVAESSGLVLASAPDHYWTHNDSGGEPVLYAFDRTGAHRGAFRLEGVDAVDWEELAAFEKDGKRWLMVADTGDNRRRRKHVVLHLVREPAPDGKGGTVPVSRSLRFRYPDGRHDCEAVAVDPAAGTIALVTKDREDGTQVYTLPLDPEEGGVLVARKVHTLELAPEGDWSGRRVTAMDLSPDGTRVALLTYTRAWEWARTPGEDWAQTLSRKPVAERQLPALQQGEALAYDRDGRTLLLTSEGVPMPLVALEPQQAPEGGPGGPSSDTR